MSLKILLVNPWIYDFAAVNLWSMPLGLFEVSKFLSRYDTSLQVIDCMDSYQKKEFGIGRYQKKIVQKPESLKSVPRRFGRYGISVDEFYKRLSRADSPDIIFITSIMSYWYPGVQKAIELVRKIHRDTTIILGGIYATLWYEHALRNSGADIVYKGNINEDISTVFEAIGFHLEKLQAFEEKFEYDALFDYPFAPVITSKGCPFNCSYCASRILNKEFTQYPLTEIINNITNSTLKGIRDFAFYDDALLFKSDTHIKPLLREIIDRKLNIRFHCPNGLHARFIDDETAYLMKKSGFVTIRLSLETVNRERQKNTGGKVNSEDLANAILCLKKYGFTKKQIGVYLMYGLPGQNLREVEDGISFIKSLGVKINLTEFSPIPGTQCWNELIENGVINENIDPLLTNNTVFAYLFSGYKPEDIEKIKLDVKEYNSL
jgi:radical SAM superfamily enzyme YgiQ (UPF0313 family)